MRKTADGAAQRNQQLEKEKKEQQAALEEQKKRVADGETERKRLEGMVEGANAECENMDRVRTAAAERLELLNAVKVMLQSE